MTFIWHWSHIDFPTGLVETRHKFKTKYLSLSYTGCPFRIFQQCKHLWIKTIFIFLNLKNDSFSILEMQGFYCVSIKLSTSTSIVGSNFYQQLSRQFNLPNLVWCALFNVISMNEKSTAISTFVVWHNFGRKFHIISIYFFESNTDGKKSTSFWCTFLIQF